MAGSLPGGALNALGTAIIPETMARLQMPALIDQAKREQQVGNIQAGRLLGGADAEIGTPQTKSYQVNGRTIGQDNPSTIQPLFSPAKKMALFSQAMPEQARAFQAQQIQNSIAPRPLSKDDFIGEPGKGIFNIRTQAFVPGTQPTPEPQKGVVVNNRFINPVTGELIKDYSDPKKQDAPPAGYRWRSDGSLEAIPGGPAAKDKVATPPAGYRWKEDGSLEPIAGGPADIGQNRTPQKFREADAGLNTLKTKVQEFRDIFSGTPEVRDPETGAVIKKATKGTGTEMFGKNAGTLDSLYGQILFLVKNAEQTGALDKGSIDVIEGMLRKPTGLTSPLQNNEYTVAQIDSVLSYIDQRQKDLAKAFLPGTNNQVGQQAGPLDDGQDPFTGFAIVGVKQ